MFNADKVKAQLMLARHRAWPDVKFVYQRGDYAECHTTDFRGNPISVFSAKAMHVTAMIGCKEKAAAVIKRLHEVETTILARARAAAIGPMTVTIIDEGWLGNAPNLYIGNEPWSMLIDIAIDGTRVTNLSNGKLRPITGHVYNQNTHDNWAQATAFANYVRYLLYLCRPAFFASPQPEQPIQPLEIEITGAQVSVTSRVMIASNCVNQLLEAEARINMTRSDIRHNPDYGWQFSIDSNDVITWMTDKNKFDCHELTHEINAAVNTLRNDSTDGVARQDVILVAQIHPREQTSLQYAEVEVFVEDLSDVVSVAAKLFARECAWDKRSVGAREAKRRSPFLWRLEALTTGYMATASIVVAE